MELKEIVDELKDMETQISRLREYLEAEVIAREYLTLYSELQEKIEAE